MRKCMVRLQLVSCTLSLRPIQLDCGTLQQPDILRPKMRACQTGFTDVRGGFTGSQSVMLPSCFMRRRLPVATGVPPPPRASLETALSYLLLYLPCSLLPAPCSQASTKYFLSVSTNFWKQIVHESAYIFRDFFATKHCKLGVSVSVMNSLCLL